MSACTWRAGAQSNVITIRSLDGRGSSSGSSGAAAHLSGGAIAGVVVGCVLGVALVAAAVAFFVLRKRRKWMSAGFAVVGKAPEPDTSVLEGPVFNSGGALVSTAAGSSPLSAARGSAAPSSSGGGRSSFAPVGSVSPPKPVAGGGVVDAGNAELDGRDTQIRPSSELPGAEVGPVARNQGVYELPATPAVAGQCGEAHADGSISAVGGLPSHDEGGRFHDSPPSPFVSTVGSGWGHDERTGVDHVSPDTPVNRGVGPF